MSARKITGRWNLQKFVVVAAVCGALLGGPASALAERRRAPDLDKMELSVMVWMASKHCSDFPVSTASAHENIYKFAKQKGKTGDVEALKQRLAPRFEKMMNSPMSFLICAKAGSEARKLGN